MSHSCNIYWHLSLCLPWIYIKYYMWEDLWVHSYCVTSCLPQQRSRWSSTELGPTVSRDLQTCSMILKKKKKTGCLPGFGGDSDHLLVTPVSLKVSSRPQTETLTRRFQMFSQMSNKVQTEDRRRVFPFPLEYFTKLWGLITLVKTHGHFHSALNHRYVTVPCKRLEPRPFL